MCNSFGRSIPIKLEPFVGMRNTDDQSQITSTAPGTTATVRYTPARDPLQL